MLKGKKGLHRAGVIVYAERFGGMDNFITLIGEAQKRGELSRKQAHDLRQEVKAAYSDKDAMDFVKNGFQKQIQL